MSPVVRVVIVTLYAILGIAATGRSSYQLAVKASEAPLPYALSAAAAVVYIVIALLVWRGAWRAASIAAAVELVGVLAVGLVTVIEPSWWHDQTVWSYFGIGYGFLPLILPLTTLVLTRRERARQASQG